MNNDTQKLLNEYAQLKQLLADLEQKKAEMELKIIENWEGDKPIETKIGNFVLMSRKTYEYSSEVTQLKEQLYKVRKYEEANGIATLKSHSQYVRFDPKN